MKRTIAVAAIVAATLLSVTGTGNASTLEVKSVSASSALMPASLPSVWPSITWHWWGLTYKYNKTATQMIASGAAAIGGTMLSANPYVGAVAAALAGSYASSAAENGNCLGLDIPWNAGVYPWDIRPYIAAC